MYPMQGPSGENEPDASKSSDQSEKHDYKWEIIVGLLIPVVAAGLAHYVARKGSEVDADQSIKLHAIHATMVLCRDIASIFGGFAINLENHYNQTVAALH